MTLSTTPRPLYRRKAETVSFLYVSLVLGVSMSSLLSKRRQNYGIVFTGRVFDIENSPMVNGTIVSLGIREGAHQLGDRPVLKGQGFNPPRGSTERKEGKFMRFEIALER